MSETHLYVPVGPTNASRSHTRRSPSAEPEPGETPYTPDPMRIYHGLDCPQMPRVDRVLAVGAFDGVHRGHRRLLGHVCRIAHEYRVESAVMTFEPIPAQVFRPAGAHNVRLSLADERARELRGQCLETAVVIDFDQGFRETTAERFAREILVERLGVIALVASKTHRFGRNAEADIHRITALGMDLGFEVHVLPPIVVDGKRINSTQIRERLWAGDVVQAAEHLGRLYDLAGEVVGGRHLGRELGFPTANLSCAPEKLVPADGVYACAARVETPDRDPGPWMPAAVSIGCTPTVGCGDRFVEAHLLAGEDLDLVGRCVRLTFIERLRAQEKFADLDALVAQIRRDVEAVQRLYDNVRDTLP